MPSPGPASPPIQPHKPEPLPAMHEASGPAYARIGRNVLAKLASEAVGRLATFLLTLYVAAALGVQAFGHFNYALAVGFVLAQLADLGLQILAARDIAVDANTVRPQLARSLRLKLWLALPVVIALLLLRASRPPAAQNALLLIGLAMLAQTFLEFAAHIYRGQQRLLHEAALLTAARLLTALLAALALWRGGNLTALALAYCLGITAVAVFALRRLQKEGWFATTTRSQSPAYAHLLRQALPLGLAIFLSIGYTRIAIFLLDARLGATAVAHFSAAQRLVEPAQMLPAALLAAVFPAYAAALSRQPQHARRLARHTSLLLAVCGTCAAIVFWLAAPWLIPLLYGAPFAPAIPVLRLLALTVVPAFLNYNLTHMLIAHGKQQIITLLVALMLGLHTALTWWLIPALGPLAPALSVTFAELFLLIGCAAALRRSALPQPSVPPARATTATPRLNHHQQ